MAISSADKAAMFDEVRGAVLLQVQTQCQRTIDNILGNLPVGVLSQNERFLVTVTIQATT